MCPHAVHSVWCCIPPIVPCIDVHPIHCRLSDVCAPGCAREVVELSHDFKTPPPLRPLCLRWGRDGAHVFASKLWPGGEAVHWRLPAGMPVGRGACGLHCELCQCGLPAPPLVHPHVAEHHLQGLSGWKLLGDAGECCCAPCARRPGRGPLSPRSLSHRQAPERPLLRSHPRPAQGAKCRGWHPVPHPPTRVLARRGFAEGAGPRRRAHLGLPPEPPASRGVVCRAH